MTAEMARVNSGKIAGLSSVLSSSTICVGGDSLNADCVVGEEWEACSSQEQNMVSYTDDKIRLQKSQTVTYHIRVARSGPKRSNAL